MNQLLTILVAALIFAGCERSNRNIEVTPNNNTGNNGQNGRTGGERNEPIDQGDGDSTAARTGSVALTIRGLSTTASRLELSWSFNGKSGTQTMVLSNGVARTNLLNLPVGTDALQISGTIDSKAIKSGSINITVTSGKTTSASFDAQSTSEDSGSNGGSTGGNNTDVILIPSIGDSTTVPPTSTPPVPSSWDGKSFKGNSSWTIEALDAVKA